jgi:hypothetical protein
MTKKILSCLALSATLLFLNACDKDDDDGPVEPAQFMLVNSSPGTPAVELYLDDVKASTTPVAYNANSGYASIAGKQYNVKIAAVNTINPIAETTINLDAGRTYSIFAYDTLLNNKAKIFAIEDDLTAPPSGKAKIRFLHLLAGPNPVAVDIAANGTVLFPNRSYADHISNGGKANFVNVDAGTYALEARIAGSPNAFLTVPGVVVEAGKIYTVLAKGKTNGTGELALGAQVIINK